MENNPIGKKNLHYEIIKFEYCTEVESKLILQR